MERPKGNSRTNRYNLTENWNLKINYILVTKIPTLGFHFLLNLPGRYKNVKSNFFRTVEMS